VSEERQGAAAGLERAGDRDRILRERAVAVARVREEARTGGLPVLVFTVGGERYAVDVGAVFQVVDASGLTPLPAMPAWVLGAVLARAHVVPVLDLRALLGLQGGGMSDLGKVVVLEHEGEQFGLAVEALEGRVDLPREELAEAPDGPFAWIATDRLVVLDLARIGAPAARGG
jgi:purine-binding chemotaxis protein CheW